MTTNPEIKELRKWLDDNRAAYLEAQAILGSSERMLEWLTSFRDKASDIMKFDPFIHPDSAAVGVVCAARERFGGVFDDIEFLEEYEEKNRRFRAEILAMSGDDDLAPDAD